MPKKQKKTLNKKTKLKNTVIAGRSPRGYRSAGVNVKN